MFEAYRVAVKVSLINHVSAGLLKMSQQFRILHGDVDVLQAKLNKIKTLGMLGAGVATAGMTGLWMTERLIKPAEEYAHQLNKLNMLGMTQAQIAEAVGAAWKTAGNVITTTATDNIRTLIDLRSILGHMSHAVAMLPLTAKAQAVLAASTDSRISSNAHNFAFSMAKAADIAGYAKDPATLSSFFKNMVSVIIETQGRVTPEAYKQVLQYARQARYSLSDDFLWNYLPTLILENSGTGGGGGGSRGVGPMLAAMFRMTNQGYVNKKSLPMLAQLGLVNGSAIYTTTSGTTTDALTGHELAASNPFKWVQDVLMPAIYAKYGKNLSKQQISYIMGQIFRGNQLADAAITEFAVKPYNYTRDAALRAQVVPLDTAYKMAVAKDPNTLNNAVSAQWDNLKTAFGISVMPIVLSGLSHLVKLLQEFGEWAQKNQKKVKLLVLGFASLAGVLVIAGTLAMVGAAFAVLAGALAYAPIATVISAVGLALYGLYKAAKWFNDWLHTSDNILARGMRGVFGIQQGTPYTPMDVGNIHDHMALDSVMGKRGPIVQVNHTSILDGYRVAKSVSHHQSSIMFGPQRSTSNFDTTRSAPFVGTPIFGAY